MPKCSSCKGKFEKTVKYKGMLLCEDCYPFVRDEKGRLIYKPGQVKDANKLVVKKMLKV